MRTLGIVLIIAGLLMFVIRGINYQTEKTVVDVGPIKIDKKENNYVGWPIYAGGFAVLAGIAVIAAGRKKV